MKKRITIIIIPTFLALALITYFFMDQFSSNLPAEGRQLLDTYIKSREGGISLKNVTYARDRQDFTADIAHQLLHAPTNSPPESSVLYDGDIIQPPEEKSQFPFPAQEVWCLTLTADNTSTELLILARHDNLYSATWVLYQPELGLNTPEIIGCDPSGL